MQVKEFFDKYVQHTDDCQKGVTSETCTCGLMKNLPHILIVALEGEGLRHFNKENAEFVARSVLGETGAIRKVQPSDARTVAHLLLAAIRHIDELENQKG